MLASADLLTAFVLFAFVSSITPGPNNTMLLASGVNFGFNRTIPHMLGISCGFFLLVVAVGFGLGAEIGIMLREHRIARQRVEHRPAHAASSSTSRPSVMVNAYTRAPSWAKRVSGISWNRSAAASGTQAPLQ